MRHGIHVLAGLVAAELATACGGGGPSGPSYPPVAGTYITSFAATWTVTNYGTGTFGDTGSITLLPASSDGAFTGSYVDDARAGTIAGTERSDGAINISRFGGPDAPPLAGLWILHSWLPGCDFVEALAQPLIGTISGDTLSLFGVLTLPCTWVVGQQYEILKTTIEISASGTRN